MVKVLGASGSFSHIDRASSFLVEDKIAIDAGNLIDGMKDKCCGLEHIFITHTHFDHIKDLPFIIEAYLDNRKKTLKIYALKENIQILQQHLFNGAIWPDFQKIMQHSDEGQPSLQFVEIEYDKAIYIDDIEITPIPSNHTTPTCGFKIKKNDHAFLISGDTYLNRDLVERINHDMTITSLLIDVSFSSQNHKLALDSKHLTPKLLQEMLSDLKRDDIAIYTYHHKPMHEESIDNELSDLALLKNGGKRLETGDTLDLFRKVKL